MGSKDQRHQQKLHLGNGGAFGFADSTTAHHSLYSSHFVQLEELNKPVPFGLQRFLNIKTGQIYYEKVETKELEPKKMSRIDKKGENNSMSAKLDMKLNLSPPVLDQLIITTAANSSASPASSPTSSCVTTDMNYSRGDSNKNPEETTEVLSNMVLVGCPNCHLYVMLKEDNLKFP
ncbi:hypothetical protein MKW98_002130 [Papaver atlanticum]|uniref:GIR1-like zinc ribbon domain-containing protein n=1 Tax=Papaver atlanticum TaxID=357466 RepID=A0AAD4RUX4_9MAGN|nr:hypothetical protein MKW98_002130 [Papaver atlanticum]